MKSLTGTLFVRVVVVAVVIMAVMGVILFLIVRSELISRFDAAVADRAETLASSIERKPYGLEVDLQEMHGEEAEEEDPPRFLSIESPTGRVYYRSRILSGSELAPVGNRQVDAVFGWHRLPDGRTLRSVRFSFLPDMDDEDQEIPVEEGILVFPDVPDRQEVVIRLFVGAADLQGFLRTYLMAFLVTGAVSIVLLLTALWTAVKGGARPVERLAGSIQAIGESDLGVRIGNDGITRELVPVVDGLNEMLVRLEGSFERERRFAADTAHELRTPLAGLKSTFQVALTRVRGAEEYRQVLERGLRIIDQMITMVERLLTLSRLEAGRQPVNREAFILGDLVRDLWEQHEPTARSRGVGCSREVKPELTVVSDRDLFERALNEVLQNAVTYVEDGGSIRVVAGEGSRGDVFVEVANSGCALDPRESERVFEKFWRGDRARAGTGSHYGLGLSLVRRIVEALGGEAAADITDGGDFRLRIAIPGGTAAS